MAFDDLRKEYSQRGLHESELAADPLVQFGHWFDQAVASGLPEPNAMTLATATLAGAPSARVVLLKGFNAAGFVFFSNYQSRKGHELAANPQAAALFYWAQLERQVRIEGLVAPLTAAESDSYFASRPAGSQIGAWASAQSQPISGREVIEARVAVLTANYAGQEVPRPPHWGGYRLVPATIEFWQGRPSRLHDRLRYTRVEAAWQIDRLSP